MLTAKRLLRGFCPPLFWELARRARRRLAPPPPPPPAYRLVSTAEEIDAALDRAAAATAVSFDACMEVLAGFRLAYPADLPADPDSAEYRAAQMALYRRVSGRPGYDPASEGVTISADHAEFPFPYFTRSCRTVGEHLVSTGLLIRTLDLAPGGRVLELGAGYGKTTIELAQMGFEVTAVDVYQPFLDLVVRRCRALGREVTPVCADMLDCRPEGRFDRVVFSASFHHCSDHDRMVARLDGLVAPGGAVVFSREQVMDDFPVPWGLNPAGDALWCVRRCGWLELGFRTDYFLGLLARHGWRGQVVNPAPGLCPPLFVARRR
jgi:SAM-dependent methyltransferase